jgi:CxxC motif-containing protein (DUF1111 family)
VRRLSISNLFAIALSFTLLAAADAPKAGFMHPEHNRDAYARPAPALSAAELRVFNFGNRLFNTNWVVAPASANGFDGLGPTFNRVSCSGCHLRDGRGRPPIQGESEFLSMLFRISVPGKDVNGGPKALANYGTQINDRAIPGVPPEAQVELSYQYETGKFADGTTFQLRRPIIKLEKPAFGAFPSNIMISPRVAPAVFGLGLLDAVAERSLLELSDPNDQNQDGISGRINRVYSLSLQRQAVGRFGWKANVANLKDQNLGAALGDIGITSPLHPTENCPAAQSKCVKAPNGGTPELSAAFAEKLNLYVQMLGVPSQRALDADARRGKELFDSYQCSACHVAQLKTDASSPLVFLREQTFNAYTDLLLHDMGEDLSDDRPDFEASGREWRTTPLWGLGLIETVNNHTFLLHDGRARGVAEAILWHGGEAEAAKEKFRNASAADRAALLAFLNTL